MEKISLQGVKNARDLGGIRTADGKVIRKKHLIKSGQLFGATPQDMQTLRDEYQVRCV